MKDLIDLYKAGITLKIGLPDGSLNHPKRGDTGGIFKRAGYDIIGYDSGQEAMYPKILNAPYLEPTVLRPQDMPREFGRGQLDAAILGEDIVMDTHLAGGNGIESIENLEYGKVHLAFLVPNALNGHIKTLDNLLNKKFKGPNNEKLTIYTEYPNIAKKTIMESETYQRFFNELPPVIDFKGTNIIYDNGEVNHKVIINHTHGGTEKFANMDGIDAVLENIQTGSSMKKHNLRVLKINNQDDFVMHSSVNLYVRKNLDENRLKMAKFLAEMLHGVTYADNYCRIEMHAKQNDYENIVGIIKERKWCLKDPTVTAPMNGNNSDCYQIRVIAPKNERPTIAYILKGLGATEFAVTPVEQILSCNN